jgi:hypothetical protein
VVVVVAGSKVAVVVHHRRSHGSRIYRKGEQHQLRRGEERRKTSGRGGGRVQ